MIIYRSSDILTKKFKSDKVIIKDNMIIFDKCIICL